VLGRVFPAIGSRRNILSAIAAVTTALFAPTSAAAPSPSMKRLRWFDALPDIVFPRHLLWRK
jgi:hypothetical protein